MKEIRVFKPREKRVRPEPFLVQYRWTSWHTYSTYRFRWVALTAAWAEARLYRSPYEHRVIDMRKETP